MKILNTFFVWLELAGLAFWVGGMMTLGALVAPAVFGHVKPIESAGETMSLIFRNFNAGMVYVCIVLVAAGFLGKWFLSGPRSLRLRIEAVLVAVLVLSGLYIGAVLGPSMETLRQTMLTDRSNGTAVAEFDRRHRQSVTLFSVNIFLGLAVLWMNARPSNGAGRKES
ncbi:MAG TPA: DUF4149 domain-containing protein [Nitrospiria bacterium]|nr:DUF4149 domain-containing protein [Nitrospiria bacterium]